MVHASFSEGSQSRSPRPIGFSVALSLDTIAVSANFEDSNQTTISTVASSNNSGIDSGAVYVFIRSGNSWSMQAYVKAPNAGGGDQFGYSLALHRDTMLVGAYTEDSNQTTITNGTTASTDNSRGDSGAAYVFFRQ